MRWTSLVAAAIAAVVLTQPVSTQPAQPHISALLDRYESGQFDEAIAPVRTETPAQTRASREQLLSAGRLWIDAPGHRATDRMAVAAMFSLDAEAVRAEHGEWAAPNEAVCAGRCVIEWACALLFERNATPDTLEHDWFAATMTLAAGVRDWTFLHSPKFAAEPFGESRGHANHALTRFPGDTRFRFARAQAIASRFEVTTEQAEPREGTRLDAGAAPATMVIRAPGGMTIGQSRSAAAIRRDNQRLLTFKELEDLATDPAVGAASRIRAAHMRWAAGEYEAAITEAEAAAAQAADADSQYLARYIAGMAAQSSGALAKAELFFASALEARPYSQSASVSLAALVFKRGDAAAAYALSADSLKNRRNDDDPWRLFQYGDYVKLPGMIAALRQALKTAVSK